MKRRIFAMALVAALILSLAMFASCTKDPEEEPADLGEEISITVTVKITGNDGNVLLEEQIPMTDYQSNLTVLEATTRALSLHDIYHEEDAGYFQLIGNYRNTGYISPNDEPTESTEPAEEEATEEEAIEETTAEVGYYWMYNFNGTEATKGAKEQELKDGDKIEWNFTQEDF